MKKRSYLIANLDGVYFDITEKDAARYEAELLFGPFGAPYLKVKATRFGAVRLRFNIWLTSKRMKTKFHLIRDSE